MSDQPSTADPVLELETDGKELIARSKFTARRWCTFDSDWSSSDHDALVDFVRTALRVLRRRVRKRSR